MDRFEEEDDDGDDWMQIHFHTSPLSNCSRLLVPFQWAGLQRTPGRTFRLVGAETISSGSPT